MPQEILQTKEGLFYVERELIPESDISTRLDEVAAEIDKTYQGKNLLIVGVLKGAFVVTSELTKRITLKDTEIDFMRAKSYNGTNSNGRPAISYWPDIPVTGRHLLLVEDIIDTGYTLNQVVGEVNQENPASLRVLALLDKPSRRQTDIEAEVTVGFTIPDVWVEGFGLDTDERNRNGANIRYRELVNSSSIVAF